MINSTKEQKGLSYDNDTNKTLNNKLKEIMINEIDNSKRLSEMKIIEYKKIIWHENFPIMEIKKLKNDFYLSYGDNKLVIFDKDFNFKFQSTDFDDIIYCVSELDNDSLKNEVNLGVKTINNFIIIAINIENYSFRVENYTFNGMFFLQISNKSFIICQDTSIQIYNDIFDRISQQHNKPIIRGQSFNCLFLNKTKDLLAITSNQILPFGKDNLTFLYINNSERNKKKSGSFITSSNGISMIESSNRANKKILLAACKKYLKNQKNGILISISLFNSIDDNITSIFYDTDNFEVYCFCQILSNRDNEGWIKSDYFFVGGFDLDTRQGLIKLYKAYFNENEEKIKIEFIDNIIIKKEIKEDFQVIKKNSREDKLKMEIFSGNKNVNENVIIQIKQDFKGFRGPITSIIQSNITGNILITCYDGNIYLFSPPNLDFYLSNEI